MFLTKVYKTLPFSINLKGKTTGSQKATKTPLALRLMLITFLLEVMCVIYQALMSAGWHVNYYCHTILPKNIHNDIFSLKLAEK